MAEKNVLLEMRNLKQTELQRLKNRGEKSLCEQKKTENHKKQRLATLKRLNRGDDKLERINLTLRRWSIENSSGWPWRQKKKEERDWRMLQLPNGSVWPWRWTKKENQDLRRW